LFDSEPKDFIEIFGRTSICHTKLDLIFSDLHNSTGIGYFLFEAESYYTDHFIEYANDEEIVFNRSNRFINLIISKEHLIADEVSIFSLKEFFSGLIRSNDFTNIIKKQKAILKLFVEKAIITMIEANRYNLKMSDFPPSFFNISFSFYP